MTCLLIVLGCGAGGRGAKGSKEARSSVAARALKPVTIVHRSKLPPHPRPPEHTHPHTHTRAHTQRHAHTQTHASAHTAPAAPARLEPCDDHPRQRALALCLVEERGAAVGVVAQGPQLLLPLDAEGDHGAAAVLLRCVRACACACACACVCARARACVRVCVFASACERACAPQRHMQRTCCARPDEHPGTRPRA